MQNGRIAVPSIAPGGLDGERAGHFGHCELFTMVDGALKAGAAGASIGRNAFQHADPQRVVGAIAKMVHESATVAQAQQFLARGAEL